MKYVCILCSSKITDLPIIRDGLVTIEVTHIDKKQIILMLSSKLLFQTFNSKKHFPNVPHHDALQSSFSKQGKDSPTFATKIKAPLMRISAFLSLSLLEI